MTTRVGKLFEEEPELDAVCMIDFENDAPSVTGSLVRASWMGMAIANVCGECKLHSDLEEAFARRVGPDEVGAWEALAVFLVSEGWGVYNSDTRFEVFVLPEEVEARCYCGHVRAKHRPLVRIDGRLTYLARESEKVGLHEVIGSYCIDCRGELHEPPAGHAFEESKP